MYGVSIVVGKISRQTFIDSKLIQYIQYIYRISLIEEKQKSRCREGASYKLLICN